MKPAIILLAALALAPIDALACSCVQAQPAPDPVDSATRVFLGKVASIERHDALGLRVTFQVTEHFKGSPVDTLHVDTAADGGMCGYPFKEDLEYVVYAYGDEGALRVHLCSHTALAPPASDLEGLRKGK